MAPFARPLSPSDIVWRPIPNSSQALALDSRCHHTLFCGSRGNGKTDTQLMRFRKRVGVGYGSFWRGVIFNRTYKQFDDLLTKSRRWFYAFGDGARFLESTSQYRWVWPTGEELLFRQISREDEYWNYHGQEFPYIAWNELTTYPTPRLYEKMMSCNRSSFTPEKNNPALPPIPLEVFSTTNSIGAGMQWVKHRFILPAPYGKVVRMPVEVFNPATQKVEQVTRTQVAIFGSYRENPYLSPEYIAELTMNTNEAERESWLKGSWDIVAGGAFDDVWSVKTHVVPRFKVPGNWRVDRSMDWGSSHPFSICWWAEANGEEVKLDNGKTFQPRSGSLVQIAEYYGTKRPGSNEGIRMGAGDLALEIKKREQELLDDGWIVQRPVSGPADNQIRDVHSSDIDTIEKLMSDKGVRWTESDKSNGSRRNGLQIFRDRLKAAVRGEDKAVYFMANCRYSITTIPVLPLDPDKTDDVDTDAEDHCYDAVRYRLLAGNNRAATSISLRHAH